MYYVTGAGINPKWAAQDHPCGEGALPLRLILYFSHLAGQQNQDIIWHICVITLAKSRHVLTTLSPEA